MIQIKNIATKEDYEYFANGTSVVKFSADWCGPCVVLARTIINLDEEKVNGIPFGEVNVDDEFADEITSKLNIRGIPVLIFFKNGEEVDRLVGAVPAQEIYNKLEKLQ